MSLLKNIKILVRNLIYLSKKDIVERQCEWLENANDLWKYGNDVKVERLAVLSPVQTVDLLLQNPKSFCRYGDGEIDLIEGKSIPFQKYNPELAEKLLKTLQTDRKDLYIGINYSYFHAIDNLLPMVKRFYMTEVRDRRNKFLEYCNAGIRYIDAGFNQCFMTYQTFEFESYYEKIKKLFEHKKVVLFCGQGILDGLQNNLFEYAESVQYEYGPSKNAFEYYPQILEKAKAIGREKLICFILGPTSKILVSELTKEGFLAWDLGHLAKDYDAYKSRKMRSEQDIQKFFEPD